MSLEILNELWAITNANESVRELSFNYLLDCQKVLTKFEEPSALCKAMLFLAFIKTERGADLNLLANIQSQSIVRYDVKELLRMYGLIKWDVHRTSALPETLITDLINIYAHRLSAPSQVRLEALEIASILLSKKETLQIDNIDARKQLSAACLQAASMCMGYPFDICYTSIKLIAEKSNLLTLTEEILQETNPLGAGTLAYLKDQLNEFASHEFTLPLDEPKLKKCASRHGWQSYGWKFLNDKSHCFLILYKAGNVLIVKLVDRVELDDIEEIGLACSVFLEGVSKLRIAIRQVRLIIMSSSLIPKVLLDTEHETDVVLVDNPRIDRIIELFATSI